MVLAAARRRTNPRIHKHTCAHARTHPCTHSRTHVRAHKVGGDNQATTTTAATTTTRAQPQRQQRRRDIGARLRQITRTNVERQRRPPKREHVPCRPTLHASQPVQTPRGRRRRPARAPTTRSSSSSAPAWRASLRDLRGHCSVKWRARARCDPTRVPHSRETNSTPRMPWPPATRWAVRACACP